MEKKRYKVTLTKEERLSLVTMTKNGKHSSRKLVHALILLNTDRGEYREDPKRTNSEIAAFLKVGESMVERIKKRFVENGLEYALDDKPAEREYIRKADGDLEAHIVAISCSEAPEGFARWSLRMLADKVVELDYVDSISHETIRQVLKKRIKTVEETRLGHSFSSKR
jgi:transposase